MPSIADGGQWRKAKKRHFKDAIEKPRCCHPSQIGRGSCQQNCHGQPCPLPDNIEYVTHQNEDLLTFTPQLSA